MKKTKLLLIVLIALTGIVNAQKSKLVGSWLMTKAEVGSEVENPYFITEFNEDGKMIVMGMDAGTWDYDKNSHTIILKSELDKDFNGEGKIVNLTEKELVVDKDGAKLFYQKIDSTEITESNKKSGLFGLWEFSGVPYPEVKTFVSFTEPDGFTILEKEEGSETRLSGTWIFNQQEMSLIMIGLRGEDFLKGENKIVKIGENAIELKSNGKDYTANRKVQNATKIERLTFTEDDFYTENGDYKYYDDEEKLPWRNWGEMKNSLLNVKQLVYNYATLIDGTKAFENKTLIANVHASLEEDGFTIDNIFNGYDRYHVPDDSEFPENSNFSEPLYPLIENTYRIVGNEQLTTPAGTFDCTILEVVSDSEVLKKLWMINDKIGVYAKVIEDNPDETFGHYCVYELQDIKQ